MTTDLTVRYSDIMQAERDFERLADNSTSPPSARSNGSDITLSVRDARKRFEQLSRSSSAGAISNLSVQKAVSPTKSLSKPMTSSPLPPPRQKKRLIKTPTDPDIKVSSTTKSAISGRVQSTRNYSKPVASDVADSSSQDVNSSQVKTKSKIKSLKKGNSISDSVASKSLATASPSSQSAESNLSRKLFKRKSMDRVNKVEDTATNGASSASSGRTAAKSSNSSSSNSESTSPSHKKKLSSLSSKFSPLSSSKKQRSIESKTPASGSPPAAPSTEDSSPVTKAGTQRSFSNTVLASPNERSVQATLGDEDKGKVVGGSRPTSPRVIEDGALKFNLTEDLKLSGADLKSILNKQLAYLSGGLEKGRHLILTFPDVGLKQLDTSSSFEELTTTLIYFKSLISIEHQTAGLTLLLDSHSSKSHAATKLLLEKISKKDFPISVHMVCIYVKTGLFGRSKQLASSEICAKLHLATFSDTKSLVDELGAENLTPELGGTLHYDHNSWVYNHLEYEKLQVLHRRAMTRVPEVKEALSVCQVPMSVKEAENLMQEDLKLKENLVNRIAEAELNIDAFMAVLESQGVEESFEIGSGKDYVTMREVLKEMMKDLKASQGQFDAFWTIHKARVDHMMRMCHFKRNAENLKTTIKGFIDDLTAGGVQLGDTLESALELGEKHELFVTKSKEAMEEQMSRMREDADVLTRPQFSPDEKGENMHEATKEAVQSVKSISEDLNTTYQQLTTMCQQKRDLFIVCVKFHMTTRQCSQWNQDVLEFLASQPVESPTYKQANSMINQIDDFLYRLQPTQIQALQELANALPGEKQIQKSVQKTIQKYEHCCDLMNNRKAALMKVVSSTASPLPNHKSAHKSKGKKHKHDKEKPEIEILNDSEIDGNSIRTISSTASPEASLYLTKAAGESSEYVDGEDNEVTLKKRKFVYEELLATERDYIKDLTTVIDSYFDFMDESETIPLRLRGKRDVVFGNLKEIYKFHDTMFSKALEQFREHPERIGECFVQFTNEFQMYSVYCKNRSNSEALLNDNTENEAFFKGIQRNLGHALPLNAYLLKPVQRITKYQLLLKDMMKHSTNAAKAHANLKQALERMLKVLKNLNDSLHVVGLKGFPGALAEQGRLLVHDPFQVWDGPGSASRSLFSRAKERHVFLFEKVIIFSKKYEAPVQKKAKKSDNYLYKGHLELADLALRETIDGQPLQFSLSVHGQQKEYKFQAQDKEIHMMWTKEMSRLLQEQFLLMKDKVVKSGTLDRRAYKGKAKLISRDTRLFGDSFKGRPEESKKSGISHKLKLKKWKKGGTESNKTKKPNGSESPLLASSSYPASIRFALKDSIVPSTASLTQSNIETARHAEERKLSESASSDDEEITFTDDDDDNASINTAASGGVEHFESLAPGAPRHYIAISAYSPGDSDENGVALCTDQEVEVIGINQYGWWWVRATNPSNGEVEEGWVPASYLKVAGTINVKF